MAKTGKRAPAREDDGKVRLNKVLAENGIASRRKADELIAAGEVMVDGEIVHELGLRVDPARQRVEVDGVVLRAGGEPHRTYLLNKPAGVICTNDAREARRRAVDLIDDKKAPRLFSVGRLDEDSTGLLILTNDGELANLVSHPRYGVPKLYKVTLRGRIEDAALDAARAGVRLSEGLATFESVALKKRGERQSTLLVGLKEGKNRQIRRVFAKLGYKVTDLARVRIGNLTDRGLPRGAWRVLQHKEIAELLAIAKGEAPPRASVGRTRGKAGGAPRRKPAGPKPPRKRAR